jgi:hypothetical protein
MQRACSEMSDTVRVMFREILFFSDVFNSLFLAVFRAGLRQRPVVRCCEGQWPSYPKDRFEFGKVVYIGKEGEYLVQCYG